MSALLDEDLAAGAPPAVETIDDVRGCRLTANEHAWIEFIRLISSDSDPRPTLARVQALRRLFAS